MQVDGYLTTPSSQTTEECSVELPYLPQWIWAHIIAAIRDPVDYVNLARTSKTMMMLGMECYERTDQALGKRYPVFPNVHHDITAAYYDSHILFCVR